MLRIGIIGLGYWGKHYVRIVSKSDRCHLTALCDVFEDTLNKYNYINVDKYINYKDMFDSGTIDAVVIVTIASLHEQIIKDALKYNLKIFVEKPYTLKYKDCQNIDKLLRKENKLMVGHTYLFNPKINYIKQFIQHSMPIAQTIHFEWTFYGHHPTDTTPAFDLAVHPLSILFWLFPEGEIRDIHSIKSSSNHTYFIQFKKGDVLVQMNISWASPGKTRKMIINNNKIKVIFDDVSNKEPIKILHVNNPQPTEANVGQFSVHADGNIMIPQIKNKEPLTEQFNHWLDYCEDKCECYSGHAFSSKIIQLCEKLE